MSDLLVGTSTHPSLSPALRLNREALNPNLLFLKYVTGDEDLSIHP